MKRLTMKINEYGFKIKLIKPFYGHNNWRTKPVAVGRVLNYSANPKRGIKLIEQKIAIKYEQEDTKTD